MNKTICAVLLSAGCTLLSAQTTAPATTTTAPKTVKSAKAKAAVQPIKIPAAAVKVSDGHYRYVDPANVAWLYTETPFGVSKVPESPVAAAHSGAVQTPFGPTPQMKKAAVAAVPTATGDPNAHVTAIAKGDMIRFQKPTPFGSSSWEKNKNELTADEQKIWDREQSRRNQ